MKDRSLVSNGSRKKRLGIRVSRSASMLKNIEQRWVLLVAYVLQQKKKMDICFRVLV